MPAPFRIPFAPRVAACLPAAGLLLAIGSAKAQFVLPEWQLPAPYGDERPDVITFALGGVSIDGDEARFRERTALSETFGGISELTIFRELGEDMDRVLKVDFRGMLGIDEGELDVSYEKLESWRLALYASHHRRYFDPESGASADLLPDLELNLDPLETTFGTIRFVAERFSEDIPTLRLRYTRFWRDGERNSTIWGQVGAQRVSDSSRELSESRDTVEVEAEKKSEERHWRVTGRYSRTESDNTLHATNNSLVNSAEPIEQSESTDSESYGAHGFFAQTFWERLTISLGGMVNETDANVSGYRMVSNGSAFVDLDGNSTLRQHVYNGNVTMRWSDTVQTVAAIAVRGEVVDAESSKNRGNPNDLAESREERDYFDFLVETRFTPSRVLGGFVLFKKTRGDGVLSEEGNRISRLTDSEENNYNFALGFRYYPTAKTSLTGKIERSQNRTQFVHERLDSYPSLYPGLVSEIFEKRDRANLRLTMRPFSMMHLVSRADVSHRTTMPRFVTGNGAGETDVDQLTLSQNVSLLGSSKWYLQAGVSLTENLHRTPVSIRTDAIGRILTESYNDHWSAHAAFYFAINEETDLQVTYTYFRADNDSHNASVAVPLETNEEEHRLNLVLSRQFTENLRGVLRYGYYEGHDFLHPDLNDYEAHVVYSTLHYRF